MLRPRSARHNIVVAFLILIVGLVGAWGLLPSPAHAASCGDAETSIISCDAAKSGTEAAKDSANNPIIAVLTFVMQILTGAVGIAAVGALIYAGILYSAAGGEAGQVQKAKTLIKDTVIGIICYAGMILILNFVIPGGVFGQQSTTGSGTVPGSGNGGDGGGGTHGGDISVATYNIRTTNGNSWDNVRANSILDYMKTEDVVGVQEGKISTTVSKNSIGWLQSKLGSVGYANYAQEQGGEYRAIFWKNDKFTQLDKGNYNIDANRNLVWVKLQYKSTGTAFYFMTVHLDYNRCKHQYGVNTTKDCIVRTNQAKSIVSYVSSHMTKGTPIVLVGDMNSQLGSTAYDAYLKGGFKNAYDIAKSKVNTDSGSTITNFSGGTSGNLSSGGKPIDHIYVMNGITVLRVEVTKHKGSDHAPVEADLSLPGTPSPSSSTPSGSTAPKLSSNIADFRDAGTSGYIKTGVLYRSANLNAATASDKLVLIGLLKGGKVIDLRLTGDTGFSSVVDKSLTGVSYLHVGIKGEQTAAGYKKTFINDSNMRAQFGKALNEIASSSATTLVHCKYGKDRTGWTIALAMMAVGVSKNNAMDEYDNSPSAQDSWFTAAYDEATNKAHTGGSGKIIDFITRDVSQGGLGVSQSTIDTLITKLRK